MPRYAAFLRGVSPMNAKMPALKSAFERAGFTDVKTVRSSGNVLFTAARATSDATLEKKAEAAMTAELDRTFLTIVRSIDALKKLLASDPYATSKVATNAKAKRVVTMLRESPTAKLALPLAFEGGEIVKRVGQEVFSVYVPSQEGPVFMNAIEETFGQSVTTRTWETLEKMVEGAEPSEARPKRARAKAKA